MPIKNCFGRQENARCLGSPVLQLSPKTSGTAAFGKGLPNGTVVLTSCCIVAINEHDIAALTQGQRGFG
jgi:hypothetical protein